MIDRDYCVMMARYNAWQNNLLLDTLEAMDPDEITRDRPAFFDSILATLNHILWADATWMSRLSDDAPPEPSPTRGVDLTPTLAAWSAERFRVDGRIKIWAESVSNVTLRGDLTFHFAAIGKDVTRPYALCVSHLFNHQTHHRGQVHDMITSCGVDTPLSDLFFLPEDT